MFQNVYFDEINYTKNIIESSAPSTIVTNGSKSKNGYFGKITIKICV